MDSLKLKDKTALITGASRGIGRSIALGFAAEGARVAVTARTTQDLDTLVRQIRALGREAVAIPADLLDLPAVPGLAGLAERELGSLDILVNNAGLGSSSNPKPVIEFDDEFWNRSLALNLTAPYLLCKAVLPSMIEREGGRIINIASLASRTPQIHGVAYATSKHGMLGLTRTLALEIAKDGITVNAICPGPVQTEMNDRRIQYDSGRLGDRVFRTGSPSHPDRETTAASGNRSDGDSAGLRRIGRHYRTSLQHLWRDEHGLTPECPVSEMSGE